MTMDMRKTRSRQYLIDALLFLMETKDLEKISVNDLVQKAQVARSTFYAQFEDKPFFINNIIEEVLADLRKETLPSYSKEMGLEKESHDYYRKHFEYIYRHANFFKAMLGPHGTPLFLNKFEESAYITYSKIFLEYQDDNLQIPMEYFIQYIISAHIGITIKWIESDLKYSAAYMAELLTNLTFYGLLHGLQMDQSVVLPR